MPSISNLQSCKPIRLLNSIPSLIYARRSLSPIQHPAILLTARLLFPCNDLDRSCPERQRFQRRHDPTVPLSFLRIAESSSRSATGSYIQKKDRKTQVSSRPKDWSSVHDRPAHYSRSN